MKYKRVTEEPFKKDSGDVTAFHRIQSMSRVKFLLASTTIVVIIIIGICLLATEKVFKHQDFKMFDRKMFNCAKLKML